MKRVAGGIPRWVLVEYALSLLLSEGFFNLGTNVIGLRRSSWCSNSLLSMPTGVTFWCWLRYPKAVSSVIQVLDPVEIPMLSSLTKSSLLRAEYHRTTTLNTHKKNDLFSMLLQSEGLFFGGGLGGLLEIWLEMWTKVVSVFWTKQKFYNKTLQKNGVKSVYNTIGYTLFNFIK